MLEITSIIFYAQMYFFSMWIVLSYEFKMCQKLNVNSFKPSAPSFKLISEARPHFLSKKFNISTQARHRCLLFLLCLYQ